MAVSPRRDGVQLLEEGSLCYSPETGLGAGAGELVTVPSLRIDRSSLLPLGQTALFGLFVKGLTVLIHAASGRWRAAVDCGHE
jgi:hypothetical protein